MLSSITLLESTIVLMGFLTATLSGVAGMGGGSILIGVLYAWQNRREQVVEKDVDNRDEEQFAGVSRRNQIRVFTVVIISAIFGGMVFNAVTMTLPKLFDERLVATGIDLSQVGGYSALVFAVAAFAQLPVGILLDRFGARPILITLIIPQMIALAFIANTYGLVILPMAMVLVLLMFAEVPVTSWLLGHFVAPNWRARAFSVEYTLSLGLGALVLPLIAWGHRSGHGFSTQYLLLAACASMVLAAALFLPTWKSKTAV